MKRTCLLLAIALASLPALTGCGSDDCRKTLTCPTGNPGTGGSASTTTGEGGSSTSTGMGGDMGTGGMGGQPAVPEVDRVFAGGAHTCATKTDGSLWCWGSNSAGQLGDGSGQPSAEPRPVTLPSTPRSMALSLSHTCATLNDGQTMCWGSNQFGQAGQGTLPGTTTPLAVPGLPSDALLRDTGPFADHTCAVSPGTGQAYCWGANDYGQLGLGTSGGSAHETAPQLVGSGFRVISPGWFHTCAVESDTSVECWGDGSVGALGSSTSNTVPNPVPVPNLTGAADICSGGLYSCVLTEGGSVLCWGKVSGSGPSTPPLQVNGLSGVEAIACGDDHACALLPDASVRCWGNNSNGQLGTGSETPVSGLATPLGLPPVAYVAAGGGYTCVATTAGAALCWGRNDNGQLGTGTTVTTSTPAEVLSF